MPLQEYWRGMQGSPFQPSGGFLRLFFTLDKPITVKRNTVPLIKNHVIENPHMKCTEQCLKRLCCEIGINQAPLWSNTFHLSQRKLLFWPDKFSVPLT